MLPLQSLCSRSEALFYQEGVTTRCEVEGELIHDMLFQCWRLTITSHTPFAGAANIEKGITIDLSSLNQVTPAKDLSTVTVGPGNRWANVYSKLDALGIAIGGGRVATVGAGGLILGGMC